MPTFREFLSENNVAYSFKTFDQLKGVTQPIPVGQADLEPKDIGDAINETVSDTLSAFGMSETAENLRDHVDSAVEEVQDIIDGQQKKAKFVVSAAGFKKTVDKLRKRKSKRKNVLLVKKLIKSLSKLDNVVEHDKNNPAQKDIGQSILSDEENAKHIVGTTVEALSEKKPTESWGTWLTNLFKKLWGGVKAIWNFIRSNIKIIASVILIVWIGWSAYTSGSLTAGVQMMSQQVVTVANMAWEACVGIFQSGYQWIMDYPVWFVKSAFGKTDQLSAAYEELARVEASKRKFELGMGAVGSFGVIATYIGSSWVGTALASAAMTAFGLTPLGGGVMVLSAAAGVTGGLVDGYSNAMDDRYRQDLLLEQQTVNFNYLVWTLGGLLSVITSTGVFRIAYYKYMKKHGIEKKDAEKYLSAARSATNIAVDTYRSNIRFKRKLNRIIMKSQQRVVGMGTRMLGFDKLADAVNYDANESCLRLDSKFMQWREKYLTTGEDFEGEFELKNLKVKEQEIKLEQKKMLTKTYMKEKLSKLKTKVDGGMPLTEENLNIFLEDINRDTDNEARDNLYADEESDGELSDTPTEEMSPLSPTEEMPPMFGLVSVIKTRLRF